MRDKVNDILEKYMNPKDYKLDMCANEILSLFGVVSSTGNINYKFIKMEQEEILSKLKEEFKRLNAVSEKQFKERFSTSKHEDSWVDELFKEYQTVKIRIELLLELLQ